MPAPERCVLPLRERKEAVLKKDTVEREVVRTARPDEADIGDYRMCCRRSLGEKSHYCRLKVAVR